MPSSAQEMVRVTGLGQKQETALAALKGGSSFPQAAQQAGVSRASVYRWVQSDPQFRAAYNEWQQEQAESARARLLGLADKAVDVVEKALGREDRKVAVGVLKNLGAMRRPDRGATDPEIVKLQLDLAREREKYQALRRDDQASAHQGGVLSLGAAAIPPGPRRIGSSRPAPAGPQAVGRSDTAGILRGRRF